MSSTGVSAGPRLRQAREQLGLSLRDVEALSQRLSEKYQSEEFTLNISRVSDFETKGVVPSPHRLYSLAVIYRLDLPELMEW